MAEKHLKEFEDIFMKEEEDYEFDEVTGAKNKRRKMDVLNKRKVSKYEMDELFCELY